MMVTKKIQKIFEESKKHLEPGEEVINWIPASHDGKTGVLLATDKRTIFYGKSLFSFKLEDIPYSKISSVEVNKEMTLYYVKIFTSGNVIKIMSVSKETMEFVQDVKKKIA